MREKDQRLKSKFGRRFDEEFKRDAVSMLESRVRTAEQLAGELGVSVWSLNAGRSFMLRTRLLAGRRGVAAR